MGGQVGRDMTSAQKIISCLACVFLFGIGLFSGYRIGDIAGKAFNSGELEQARVDLESARSELDTVRSRIAGVAAGLTESVGVIEGLVSKAGIERDRIRQSRILVEAGREAVKALRGALVLLPTDDSGAVNP